MFVWRSCYRESPFLCAQFTTFTLCFFIVVCRRVKTTEFPVLLLFKAWNSKRFSRDFPFLLFSVSVSWIFSVCLFSDRRRQRRRWKCNFSSFDESTVVSDFRHIRKATSSMFLYVFSLPFALLLPLPSTVVITLKRDDKMCLNMNESHNEAQKRVAQTYHV